MRRPLEVMVKELIAIAEGVSKGLLEFIVPPVKPAKPKWCSCSKCGRWHYVAE